jgi:hypothetical protein
MGLTFDDTDAKGVASSISRMHELIAADPRNAERIKPYIGGEEVLSDPAHGHHRYIIDFGDMALNEARQWPDLITIVTERVKPQRDGDKRDAYRRYWWRFAERRGTLYATIAECDRVLVKPQTAARFALTFLDNGMVYDQTLIVIALESWAAFAILQSRVHETWASFFGPTLKDDNRYTPSDVFETYPFPDAWSDNRLLGEIGRAYFEYRAEMMLIANEGLTKTYNRFHKPSERSQRVQKLRELHAELDRAVLDAYGWTDISERAAFVPEWTDAVEDAPVRYTWPHETRDEVLVRLLQLNGDRALEEARLGLGRSFPREVDAEVGDEFDKRDFDIAETL